MNEFCSESEIVKSNLFISPTKFSLGTQLTQLAIYYCNRFALLFTQIIHKKTNTHTKMFNLIIQHLEKYHSTVQQLAFRGWHQVNRQEELQLEEGEEVGDGRAERSSAIGDGRQAAVSLTPYVIGHTNAHSQLEGS